MKFTFSWLKDYLDTKLDIYQIANILTGIGLEVENIQDKSKVLAPFTVAYVKNVEKHPNADRLKICQVETKKGVFQVVCGAPNATLGIATVAAAAANVTSVAGCRCRCSRRSAGRRPRRRRRCATAAGCAAAGGCVGC